MTSLSPIHPAPTTVCAISLRSSEMAAAAQQAACAVRTTVRLRMHSNLNQSSGVVYGETELSGNLPDVKKQKTLDRLPLTSTKEMIHWSGGGGARL